MYLSHATRYLKVAILQKWFEMPEVCDVRNFTKKSKNKIACKTFYWSFLHKSCVHILFYLFYPLPNLADFSSLTVVLIIFQLEPQIPHSFLYKRIAHRFFGFSWKYKKLENVDEVMNDKR